MTPTGATSVPMAALTDVGRRREHNEDSLLAELPLLAVADGVGGSAKGEVASQRALEALGAIAGEVATAPSSQEAVRAMERAVLAANDAVHEAQARDPQLRGMATTVTAAVLRDGGEVIVGHVGDSRLYVISAAGARLATEDHSVVAELVRSGRIAPEDAAHHPQRNVITRAVGQDADISVDAFVLHVGPGDWLLACSDGLTEHVSDVELARAVLKSPHDPAAAVRRLVDQANERGGTDNITVLVAQPVPSDVSGELRIEQLEAAATTAQLRVPVASGAQADESGPLRAVETSGEIPVQLLTPQEEIDRRATLDARPYRAGDEAVRSTRVRRALLAVLVAVVAAGAGAFVWSQSYFLTERGDGRVGIDRGFPLLGLSARHRTSDVDVEELSRSDRDRLVRSHRLLGEADAERVLDDLAERSSSEERNGIATSS